MSLSSVSEIITIVTYIVPGYIFIYMAKIYFEYLDEKHSLERIIQYLFFSTICYFFAVFFLSIIGIIGIFTNLFDFQLYIALLSSYKLIITSVAITLAFFFGPLAGKFYFSKGYPYKHFDTHKVFQPSIYQAIADEYFGDLLMTFHLKDGRVLRGRVREYDLDHDNKEYIFSLVNTLVFDKNLDSDIKLTSDLVLVNTKDANFIEIQRESII